MQQRASAAAENDVPPIKSRTVSEVWGQRGRDKFGTGGEGTQSHQTTSSALASRSE